MARYINPLTDFGFKFLFGEEENKEFLIEFLNTLFGFEDRIIDITYTPTEDHHSGPEDRALIYDVHCTTQDGRHFIVEMQNRYQAHFRDRALYYLSSDVVKQGKKGQAWDYSLDGVIGIFFMNFDWKGEYGEKSLIEEVGLMNIKSHQMFSDKLKMIFLKLPLVKKTPEECKTYLDQWLYVIKNLEKMDAITFNSRTGTDIFQRLGQVAEIANLSEAQRNSYEQSLKAYRDNYAVEKTALEEGRAEGMAAMQRKVILNMRTKGMNDSEISELTGIPMTEVLKIASD